MSVVCLRTFREERRVLELIRTPEPTKPEWQDLKGFRADSEMTDMLSRMEARFGDKLPAHFRRCLSKPQARPYMHGDVHNVSYRKPRKGEIFNRPYPVPCYVTAESCLKQGDALILGSKCREGRDEPFPWMDQKYRSSLNFLRSLPDQTVVHITTRSDLIAHEDYLREIVRLHASVTILCPAWASDEEIRRIEPGAPSKARRIKAVERLREFHVRARMEYHDKDGGCV